jgi:hypothetical protein
MKIKVTDILTGKQRVCRATLTIDHPASSYGQPVLLVDGEPWGIMECVLHNPQIVQPPKAKAQIALLAQWQRNLQQQTAI